MSKTITPKELKNLLNEKKDIVILDVRRKSDYEADPQMIHGAIWQDPEKVEDWSRGLLKDKETVIYCVRGGSVSKSVANRLAQENVKTSYIEGGITAWRELGEEVGEE